ncbi:MAG TPA: alpha-L-fucosidase [Sulfuricurvum sp.]|nr:alpha-L-fucosidase [Sulfuricurvum sp.]
MMQRYNDIMHFHMPPRTLLDNGEMRHVGFELEFSGLELEKAVEMVAQMVGGNVETFNPWYHLIKNTPWGNFILVLDFQFLINSGLQEWLRDIGLESALDSEEVEAIEYFLGTFSASLVPYELTTPALPLTEIAVIETIKNGLRDVGALGTTANPLYVFGFHINPEIPSLDAHIILAYLRAFLVLEELLQARIKPDFSRRLSPYIDPFGNDYIMKVLHPSYRPDMTAFIDDYLDANPTRNRALDLLPLLAWIDRKRVVSALPDEKITPRPTLHFRLPNSRIDEHAWHTYDPWNSWVLVERLATDNDSLTAFAYSKYRLMKSPFYFFRKKQWVRRMRQWAETFE